MKQQGENMFNEGANIQHTAAPSSDQIKKRNLEEALSVRAALRKELCILIKMQIFSFSILKILLMNGVLQVLRSRVCCDWL